MCFSLAWLANLLIWIVVVAAVIAVLKLLIPWALGLVGIDAGPLMQIIQIIIYAIVAIFVIVVVFALLSCLMGGGGFALPPLLHR
jgi:hypothetical protein